jgi:hypothetical protein
MNDKHMIIKRLREIPNEILVRETRCGSCDLWMTSRCPQETLLPSGRKSGPSSDDRKCLKFEMKAWVADSVKRLKAEKAELEGSLQ